MRSSSRTYSSTHPAMFVACPELASGSRAFVARTSDWSTERFVQDSPGDAGRCVPNARPAHALYYYRARYYQSRLQRFISEDPIGLRGRQTNLYGYVRNAPTIYIDPYGLVELQIGPNIPQRPNPNKPAQGPFPAKNPFPVPPSPDPNAALNQMIQDLNELKRIDCGGPPGIVIFNGSIDTSVKPWPPSVNFNGFHFQINIPF